MNTINTIIEKLREALALVMRPTISVKLDEGAFLPVRAHDTDAGADIRTPCAFTVPARGTATVATGVHVQTPPHCATMIKSKSGLNVRYDITSEGVVDEGFTGEVIVKLYNHGEHPKRFERGDKITQIVVVPVLYPLYAQAEEIDGGERGDAGYGSTGR